MSIKGINTTNVTGEERQLHSSLKIESACEDIKALKQSAGDINLQIPDAANWRKINNRIKNSSKLANLKVNSVKKYASAKNLLAMAATVSFLCVSWLGWNNHQLQKQLEIALKVNKGMELQLAEYSNPRLNQLYLLQEIRAVEDKLITEKSLKVKIDILKQRSVLMQQILEYQKGGNDEFSI